MRIEMEEPGRLKISLIREDLARMGVTYAQLDYGREDTRRMLWTLLSDAGKLTGFAPAGRRLLIEAFPAPDGGCVLYFTQLDAEKDSCPPARARLRRAVGVPYIFEFSAGELLEAAAHSNRRPPLQPVKSSLYKWNGRFRLAVRLTPVTARAWLPLLGEYGRPAGKGEAAAAYMREHGQLLMEHDALRQIARHFAQR